MKNLFIYRYMLCHLVLLLQCKSSFEFTLLHPASKYSSYTYLEGHTMNINVLHFSPQQNQEQLENDLVLIEAIEERNKAQMDSFIDKKDQWDSMEESERELLRNKDAILKRLEELKSE